MSAVTSPAELTTAERQEAAREVYRASLAAGSPISGAELGRRFGMSARWGVARRAEVDAERNADDADVADQHAAGMEPEADQPAEVAGPQPAARRPWYAVLITVLVGLVAAAASYGHMYELAIEAGEPKVIAFAAPLTVDGLVLAALLAGERGRWWLRLALLASVAANVAAADPTMVGYLVAGWPPLALYGTHRLLHGASGPPSSP